MKATKPRWCDRRIAAPGPFLTLVLSQAEFDAELQRLGIKERPPYLATTHAQATMHQMEGPNGLCCVVALGPWGTRNPIEVAGLLVYEAVHVWQEYAKRIGENNPGAEQEAYAIQSIAQELMAEFSRRMGHPVV